MKKIAIPKTLAGLLVHLLGDAVGMPSAGSGKGPGQRRAEERLAAKRKANAEMSKGWPERQPSRQVLRARTRRVEKDARSFRKANAMRDGLPGGAAAVQ